MALYVIGILTWNREKQLPLVLEYVYKTAREIRKLGYTAKTIIVDNKSEDKTREIIVDFTLSHPELLGEIYFERCKIPEARNKILFRSRKLGAKRLLFVDDDVLVNPVLPRVAEEYFREDPELAIILSTTYTHYGLEPILPEQLVVKKGVLPEIQYIVSSWMGSTILALDRIPSDIWFDNTKVVLEDIDFMQRVVQRGLKIARLNYIKSVHWKISREDTSYDRTVKLWDYKLTIRPAPHDVGRSLVEVKKN